MSRSRCECLNITERMRAELRAHAKQTGLGPQALLRGAADKPKGLTAAEIRGWLGRTKTVRRDRFEYVMRRWQEADSAIPLAPDIRLHITQRLNALDLTPASFLHLLEEIPEKLNAGILSSWLDGATKHARNSHLNCVLQALESLVIIDPALRARLSAHRARTGIGAAALCRTATHVPAGLDPERIHAWLAGQVKVACRHHLDFVLEAWQALPERQDARAPLHASGYRTEELFNCIRKIRQHRKIDKACLAQVCGVTRGTINAWEIRQTPFKPETARKIATALGCAVGDLYA